MLRSSGFGRLTLLQQWALATLLAVLPLMVAAGYAVFSLQQQTARQTESMQRFDRLADATGRLMDDVSELVRLARQYRLLRDETFLELFVQKNETLGETLGLLRSLPLESGWRRLVVTIGEDAALLEDSLAVNGEASDQQVTHLVQTLLLDSDDLASAVSRARQANIQQGEREFARIVDRLFLIAMLTLPGTFLLMVLGTFLISRPIWRLSQAIRRLGRQQWDEPIVIGGPADLVALGNNLEWMRQQICASDEQRTAFIQHVTHELKTPLAAIIEAASLMRDEVTGALQPGQREVLEILFSNARHLQDLIQQLLNYNAVSHGLMAHFQPVDMAGLCETLRQRIVTANPDKSLRWELSGNVDSVTSDPRLLEMILANLMGNAFQFTPDGGSVTVRWEEDRKGWCLSVSDTGTGIERSELDHIFAPFYRGRNTRGDSRPGNGIGLAIVKAAADLLNGSISVHSGKGEGTAFLLFFPHKGVTRND